MISNVLGSNFHRFSLTQYPFEHSLKIPGETSSKPSNFISRLTAILLVLGYFIGFSGNTQANISVDAMDPRAKGESTNKAYTDDEIKWRVGLETPEGGSNRPTMNITLAGKNSLCDGEIRIPPGWQVVGLNVGEEGNNGNIGYSHLDDEDIDDFNQHEGEVIDPNLIITPHTCDETQTLTIQSGSWISDHAGSGMILKKPVITEMSIGNTGGDGQIPVVHETNGKIYMSYHFAPARIQCIDVFTGNICPGYLQSLDLNGKASFPNFFGQWDQHHFVGDKLFFPLHQQDGLRNWKSGMSGIGCFDVNSNQPMEMGPCDGKNGRGLFGNGGEIIVHPDTGESIVGNSVVGPYSVNGKLFTFSIFDMHLYCFDPNNGMSCGNPYPKNLKIENFEIPWRNVANGTRIITHDNKLYIIGHRATNFGHARARCWDTVALDFCWGNKLAEMPKLSLSATIPNLTKHYDKEGNFDGFCAFKIHGANNQGGCIEAETGNTFPDTSTSVNGVPNELFNTFRRIDKWSKSIYGTTASKTFRVAPGEVHGRSYYVGFYSEPSGVICWDWSANEGNGDFCYHYENDSDRISDNKTYFGGIGPGNGGNGHLVHAMGTEDYGVVYDGVYGCFWVLGDANILWSFDEKANMPCSPSSFQASRIVDPEALFCASGAPVGWKWNTVELYDFSIDEWDQMTISLHSLETGLSLVDFKLDEDAASFVETGNHTTINLLNNPEIQTALQYEKRLMVQFNGIASDDQIIRVDRNPTVIATINSKKPIEFCINAKTGEGQAGCGAATLSSNMTSQNGLSVSNESGVQVVEYTPDPESHTQPTLYVDQGKEDGFGIMVRPYIYPVLKQGSDIEVNGVSTVQALFVKTIKDDSDNKKLFFMEDSNENQELNVDDKRVVYSPNDKHGMGAKIGTNSSIQHFNQVKPLWDAHTQLDQVSDENVLVQRDYTDTDTDSKRYIFTWLDDRRNGSNSSHALDGIVDPDEVVDFTEDLANLSNKGLFKDIQGGQPSISVDKVKSIIRFVRGDSRVAEGDADTDGNSERNILGYRERRIVPPSRGSQETFRLGGLRHSKALIVGAPQHSHMSSRYNGDNDYMVDWAQARDLDNYRQFKDKYKNRRLMVYVGGNDGMIHAFNSGFIDFENRSIDTQSSTNSSAINWPLGKEVWAYVPRAVLPYLYDLTHPLYKQRYYIDGNPLAFDVRLFSHSTTHPGGWATILVVPMRMGGGFAEVELSSGEIGDITPVYVVLDITNPEQEPKLLAEITHQDLGFTTSEPTIVYETLDDELIPYLVFGSGPTNSTFALSDKVGKVFMYNLIDDNLLVRATLPTNNDADGNPIPLFAGDMKAINLRSAFTGSQINSVSDETLLATDVVYFGVSSGSDVRKLGGRIMRLNKNQSTKELSKLETLLEPKVNSDDSDHPGGRPIVYAPTVSVSFEGKRDELWIYAGTGRLLVDADESNIEQQYVLGIIEKSNYDDSISTNFPITVGSSDIQMNKLVDVTDINVESNGALAEDSRNISGLESGITNERQLAQRIINDDDGDQVDGWLRRLTLFKTGSGDNELVAQSGRITGRVGIVRNQLIVSEFLPPTLDLVDQCQPSGKQIFYRFAKDNGTADETVLTEFTVTDASLNDADFIDWDGDLGVGAGSTTRLDPEDFYGLGGDGKRIRWREVEEIK